MLEKEILGDDCTQSIGPLKNNDVLESDIICGIKEGTLPSG